MHLRRVRRPKIICVRGRLLSDTILESRGKYYQLVGGLTTDKRLWRFFVLEKISGAGQQPSLYRVNKIFNFPETRRD